MGLTLLCSLLLCSLSILSLANDSFLKNDEHPMDCEPSSCRYVKNITYPFWVDGPQPPHCGLPAFRLTCKDGGDYPVIVMPAADVYQVRNIFYENESFVLANDQFVNKECPILQSNLSFSLTPFNISAVNRELAFMFNCSTPPPNYYELPCGDRKTFAFLGDHRPSSSCETAILPVLDYSGADVSDYARVINNGFLVEWVAPNCSECRESKGQCGYSVENQNFMCICPDRAHWRSCNASDNNSIPKPGKKSNSLPVIIGIGLGSGGLLLACALLVIYVRCCSEFCNRVIFWEKKNNDQNIKDFLVKYRNMTPKRYTYSDLKRITKSFQKKLGQGGYGTVFKGTLFNGREVAVKVLSESKGNGEEFLNEVSSIGMTSHVNIVSLLGFCYERSKRALIYEFMCNGSLDKFVYSVKPRTAPEWERLYNIAVGIARGLEYLHRGCSTRIVHFDIKPHNILLDQDFCPKISDFGLAKLCLKKESIISMAGFRGTIGYIAPEVFSRNFGIVSSKSDVYSYGMMVLEMVGGRKNATMDAERSSETYFPHWIYEHLKLDGDLQAFGITGETEESARKMTIVGLWCIQTNPQDRPTITKVIEMLEGNTDDLDVPPKPYLCTPLQSLVGTSSIHDGYSKDDRSSNHESSLL